MQRSLGSWLPITLILICATVLLTWRLDAIYLWQDEAATAVLAERMLKYGKPLAYDGRNLITMDSMADEDRATLHLRTGDPEAMLKYLVARKDFRADTTWVNQPWGQFVAAAVSLGILGHGTWQARLPFALAGIATVLLLYLLVLRVFRDRGLALLSAALLVANVFWVLNARQARYYALSSLFLVLSVTAFLRWQRGARWGAALFVLAGWLYFQSDFGSFFPTMGVLALVAAVASWPRIGRAVGVFAILGASIAPFGWYYGIHDRVRNPIFPIEGRIAGTLYNANQFILAFPILLLAAWLVWWKRKELSRELSLLLASSLGVIATLLVWVPTIAPAPFIRYMIQVVPLAALVTAWTISWAAGALASLARTPSLRPWAMAVLSLLVAGTGVASAPAVLVTLAVSDKRPPLNTGIRPELTLAASDIFVPRPDPNRLSIEALRPLLRPRDEILVNYEDVPFMFYTDALVRGGIAAFRVEDVSAPPPRFAVIRQSVPFVHWPVFQREFGRHQWQRIPTGAPDVRWGNFVDPNFWPSPASAPELIIGERVGP